MPSSRNLVIVGSLRKESFSRMVARALIAVTPQSVTLEVLEIAQLPMYNQDLDNLYSKEWVDFRKRLKEYDGIVFVNPETQRYLPTEREKGMDTESRPYGQNIFDQSPGAVIGVSLSTAGFGASHHMRQSLVFLNLPTMPEPEVYVSTAAKLFESNGNLSSQSTRTFLNQFMSAFVNWAEKNKH